MLTRIWPFKKESSNFSTTDAALFTSLFQFLTRQITAPKNAEQLIQLGHKASNKSQEEIFHIYLLFEKYICSFEPEQKYTRQSLRQEIGDRFPELGASQFFKIVFLSDTEKKNVIACQFLFAFIAAVTEQFGQAGEGYFEKKKAELKRLEMQQALEETFLQLQSLSLELFQFVQKNYGEGLAGKIFEKNYHRLSTTYKELEVFPHLVALIPKDIVRREHLGIFTQSQIEQVFLEKLSETERLNQALAQKVRELETMQMLLSDKEAMLSSVISSAPDAIVMTDSRGMIIQWNETATEIFGFTSAEITGRPAIGTIFPELYLRKLGSEYERFLKDGGSRFLNRRMEIRCMRKSGETFPSELTITSFYNNNECYFNGFIRDITLPKKRQVELVRTKEKAEQAARAKSQFLSVMSHEIRTPLNAIIGFTELLQQNMPREDQVDDLRMLKFSGESLLSIINDILDFSKLDSGKVQLSLVSFNLRELVQSLYQSFSYKAKEKQIIFDVEYDPNMPHLVKGDNLRLSQILNNLVSNAIKFTSAGSVILKVKLEEITAGGIKTYFSVCDSGIGIPPEKHQAIFEQFVQADSNTTRLFGGTGLGLSISGKLAQLMGSRIIVESSPGKGSTFSFGILFQYSAEPQSTQDLQPNRKKKDILLGKRILLAEDNAFNAEIARRFIKGWGADMDVALDGQQALEFALRKEYDLILMDIQMPVLDGFACSRAIRKHLRQIPILAITAAPINEVQDQILQSGMDDYVSKPFKPNELFNKLERFLLFG